MYLHSHYHSLCRAEAKKAILDCFAYHLTAKVEPCAKNFFCPMLMHNVVDLATLPGCDAGERAEA